MVDRKIKVEGVGGDGGFVDFLGWGDGPERLLLTLTMCGGICCGEKASSQHRDQCGYFILWGGGLRKAGGVVVFGGAECQSTVFAGFKDGKVFKGMREGKSI